MGMRHKVRKAFTLAEILAVVSIISLLLGILLPVLGQARRQACVVIGMHNQRQIVLAVSNYAVDNRERYPESVATITFGNDWHWQEPTMMAACKPRPSRNHRAMAAYLGHYVADARTMFCPNAPRKYKYLRDAWEAGDDWDNPETSFSFDPVLGSYCFYWGYTGFLGDQRPPFMGPRNTLGGRGQSKLLVSDYFGHGHHRSPDAYGSCERFGGAGVTAGTEVSSAYWSRSDSGGKIARQALNPRLHAGYTDGHVQSFSASEAVPMQVSIVPDGTVAYPSGVGLGPGDFYLPGEALR
jgi:prepilin-type N-terminal cleavage/methylation domain-containing protein